MFSSRCNWSVFMQISSISNLFRTAIILISSKKEDWNDSPGIFSEFQYSENKKKKDTLVRVTGFAAALPAVAPSPGRPAGRAAGTSARRCASAAGCAAGAGAASAGRMPPAAYAAAAAGPGWSDPGACWTGPGPGRWAAPRPPTGWAAERTAAEASRSPSCLQRGGMGGKGEMTSEELAPCGKCRII